MFKSALGVIISLIAFMTGGPAYASDVTAAKAHARKHNHKKNLKRKAAQHAGAQGASLDVQEKRVKRAIVVHGKRKTGYQHVAYAPTISAPPVMTAGDMAGLNATPDPLGLKSNAALVIDQTNSQVLFEKNAHIALPIASLTKLMTALVVVETHQDMEEMLEVTADDVDHEKNSSSRLRVGARMTRANMLHIALMSSENRAASALGRNYPGGLPAFVAAMNAKAKALGMNATHYVDSTGLSSHNVANAHDLAKLVMAAHQHAIIRKYSTDSKYAVDIGRYRLQYITSNHLVMNSSWNIGLQKTGYIAEAGRCLVMQAKIEGRPVVMVFLDSKSKDARLADVKRIRKWLETTRPQVITQAAARQG